MSYSSLHNHSYYSIADGLPSPKEYMERAKELGLKAIALTEHGNLYSAPYMHKLKKDYPDIKVIYGYEAYEAYDHTVKDPDNKYFHLVVLAKNERGRIAVNELITMGEFEGFYHKGRIDKEQLRPYANDIIVTSACMASKLNREKDYDKCVQHVKDYKEILGDNFFLEMQSHRSDEQAEYNRKILQLAKDTDTPFIITTDSHAVTEKQLKYQGYFVMISHDADTINEAYEGCYLQSVEEIHKIMDEQIGWEHVVLGLETTNYLADMIEDVQMPFQEPQMPTYPIPEGYTQRSYVEKLLEDGWKWRGFDKMSEEDQRVRRERIQEEMDTIDTMGYMGYFIIVWDFINWARNNCVLVGVGRGSAGSSMVCYLLGIVNLDPIRYGLVFSRFLNIERRGLPDIDTDVSDRDKIIAYMQSKYGKDSVCQIANFSYMTPAVAITDAARVLDKIPARKEKFGKQIGVKTSREISKLFSYPTWKECIEKNSFELEKYSDEIFEELFEVAEQLSGAVRHMAVHAGGVGVVDGKVTNIMPMKNSDGASVVMADKRMAEPLGIIKFDVLGLRSLSVIDEATRLAGIDPWEIDPMNEDFLTDKATFDLISAGDTDNVFQLESVSMSTLVKQVKPRDLATVSVCSSLMRPDTMAMLNDYIARRNGEQEIVYLHEDMKPILEETLGVQAYQEQTLQIIRTFGGWSYGRADLFRRAVSKKIPEEIKRLVSELHGDIIANGYSEKTAEQICSLLKDKGGLNSAPYVSDGI